MNITGKVLMNARSMSSGMIDLVSSNKWKVTTYGDKQTTLKPTNGKFNNYGIHLKNGVLSCTNVSDNINNTEDCTICMWINSSNSVKELVCIGAIRSNDPSYSLCLCFNSANIGSGISCYGYVASYTGLPYIPMYSLNEWHHAAFTRNNGTSYFFEDGVLKWSGSFPYTVLRDNYFKTDSDSEHTVDAVYDDIVIIKGQALWTADYTLPTDYITGVVNGSYSTPYYYDNTGAPLPTNNLYLKQYKKKRNSSQTTTVSSFVASFL